MTARVCSNPHPKPGRRDKGYIGLTKRRRRVLLLVMRKFLALLAFTLPLCAEVKLTKVDDDHISVNIDGKPFTDFFFGANTAKPYMWPLRAASGTVVTRGYPIDANIPGETHDH